MPRRDRQHQSRYEPYDDRDSDGTYDDVFIDERWADESDDYLLSDPPRRTRSASSNPDRMVVHPAVTSDGTAAQIERLRRAMRTGSGPARAQSPQPTSRPAPGWRPDRPTRRIPDPSPAWDDGYDDPYTPSSRQTTSPTPYPDDPYIENSRDWDDEYYGEYEDDFSEYDDPRPAPRSHRQLVMPTLTIPAAITDAPVVRDRTTLTMIGVSAVGLIAMAIVTGNRINGLEPGFAAHVSASGVLEDMRAPDALWNLPIMSVMLTLMAVAIAWFTAEIDRFASRLVLGGAWLVQFVAWVALIRLLT